MFSLRAAVPLVVLALPAAAQAQEVLLRLRPAAGSSVHYRMTVDVWAEGAGLPFSSDEPLMRQTMLVTQHVVGYVGDTLELDVSLDSMRIGSSLMGEIPVPAGLEGLVYRTRMTDRARIVSTDLSAGGSAELAQVLENVKHGFSGLGYELPEDPVQPGQSWTGTQDVTVPGVPGQPMDVTSTATLTLDRVERVDGRQIAVVTLEVVVTTQGGIGGGAEGEGTGVMALDLTYGRVANLDLDMMMNLTGPNGQQVAMTSQIGMRSTTP